MKQLNIGFDDDLYESIVKTSIGRDLTPTDLVRATMRNLMPEIQKAKVTSMKTTVDSKCTKLTPDISIDANAKLMIVSTQNSKIWFAEVEMDNHTSKEGILNDSFNKVYRLEFEDGRSGICKFVSLYGLSGDTIRGTGVGVTGLFNPYHQ